MYIDVNWKLFADHLKSIQNKYIAFKLTSTRYNGQLVAGCRSTAGLKHAIVRPLLKKPGLHTADMGSYRPVSNLSFMSKVVERAVATQLNDYLVANNLLPRFQSV